MAQKNAGSGPSGLKSLKTQLALGTAMASFAVLSYSGRNAYAACNVGAPGVYVCDDALTTTQTLSPPPGLPLSVTTSNTPAPFSIDTTGTSGHAFDLDSDSGITFTDTTASTIIGQDDGINAYNNGSGAISITTTSAVTGTGAVFDHAGIGINNHGTDTTVASNGVSGESYGIRAVNRNTGTLTVTDTGTITTQQRDGIYGVNYDPTTSGLTISANTVNAGVASGGSTFIGNGIRGKNAGTGALSISASGNVSGTADGVYAANQNATGTNIIIDVDGTIDASRKGIRAINLGTGFVDIDVEGKIMTSGEEGIYARNDFGTGISIEVSDVDGPDGGIVARNNGGGILSVTSTGLLDTLSESGLDVSNNGTDLTLDVHNVKGVKSGILATNNGSGALSIVATGYINGGGYGGGEGIYARNVGTTTDIQTDGTVYGSRYGIFVGHGGSGNVNVTNTATLTGNVQGGVRVDNASGTDITINANNASGGGASAGAVSARNTGGSGTTTINITGTVNSTANVGIETETDAGMMSIINILAGANVSGGGGSIYNNVGDSMTTVTGATISGNIALGDGSDDLTFNGGNYAGVTTFDGGDDTSSADGFVDRITFSGVTGGLNTTQLINWEQMAFSGADFTLTGTLTAPELIDLRNGSILDVTGDFDGTGGTLMLDLDLPTDAGSRMTVGGNVTGTPTTVSVNANNTGPATGNDIVIVSVTGTTNPGDFMLDGNPIGAFSFDLDQNGTDWFLTNPSFSPETPLFEVLPNVLGGLNTSLSFNDRLGERYYGNSGNALPYAMGYADAADLDDYQQLRSKAVWGRIEGTHAKFSPDSATVGAAFDKDQFEMRFGVDAAVAENDAGFVVVGINGFYGQAEADVSASVGNGEIDATAYGVGASVSFVAHNGFYADLQGHARWFSADLISDTLALLEEGNDGTGHALSAEIGLRLENGGSFAITPQAQLIYSDVDFESFTSAFGTAVSMDDAESLKLRLGALLEHGYSMSSDDGSSGGHGYFHVRANATREFKDGTTITAASVPFSSKSGDWTGEIGIGGTFHGRDDVYSFYTDASVAADLENAEDSYEVSGSAGVKIRM